MRVIERSVKRIKELKVQGATNVCLEALKALNEYSSKTRVTDLTKFLQGLRKAVKLLNEARPTEPMLRNVTSLVLHTLETTPSENPAETLEQLTTELINKVKSLNKTISQIGKNYIKDDSVIFTHCHSSTVMSVIKEASKEKKISLICTETRPLYQGRITAREAIKAGIKTTMIVDSNALPYIKKSDVVLLGCDSIRSDGSCVNKVGSSTIAFIAKELETPLFICTNTLKYDAKTLFHGLGVVEERDSSEVWSEPPKGLVIKNPAFDVITRESIRSFITELGVFPPAELMDKLRAFKPWLLKMR